MPIGAVQFRPVPFPLCDRVNIAIEDSNERVRPMKWVYIQEPNENNPYSASRTFLGLQADNGTIYCEDDWGRPVSYTKKATINPYKGLIGVEEYMFFVRTKESLSK